MVFTLSADILSVTVQRIYIYTYMHALKLKPVVLGQLPKQERNTAENRNGKNIEIKGPYPSGLKKKKTTKQNHKKT